MKWHPVKMALDQLKPAKYNPRKMSPKQKADLLSSLQTFGLADPLIINRDGTIIGGHQRFAILKERFEKEGGSDIIDCMLPEDSLEEAQEKELNLRLNKNQGEFDLGLLTAFDPALLATVGFDGDMIDTLFELEAKEDDYDVDKAVAAIVTPKSIQGDVYEFPGGHRLMCGSSTEFGDVEKLMNGKMADLVITDPPYNVAYKGKKGIKNDDQTKEEFLSFLQGAFTNAFAVSAEHANCYSWFAMSNYADFRSSIEAGGWRYMQVCIWLKDRFVLSFGQYFHRATEPVMVFYRDWNKKRVNSKYAKNSDVWQMDRLTFEESLDIWYQQRDKNKDYQHPTQKPVRLGERALKRNSEAGDIVLDLFMGGGSTLLCAHQLQRVCYGMELDPKYCDVIVDRFTKMTGEAPKRLK